ncbi:MAG TPA: acylneuraminate cytidylyltransferase family protein, partial [Gemmatimonadaceae bacterium]|nr:acylneuraminate cytidylyltransferase family protein [Gemmatimonadaceae bacterium]
PAIAYTIRAALGSGVFDRVVVSTDSDEIARVAREHGAEVPFVRDASLADDDTPVSLATVDALERLDPGGERFARVAQLMANCPLRDAEDVRASWEQFTSTGARSQLSVMRFGFQNPWWAMRRGDDYVLDPLFGARATAPSQSLPELFCPTGAIWWARAELLRAERTFHVDGRTGWEISWQHAVDVDTEDDWAMAELLARLEARARGESPERDVLSEALHAR